LPHPNLIDHIFVDRIISTLKVSLTGEPLLRKKMSLIITAKNHGPLLKEGKFNSRDSNV